MCLWVEVLDGQAGRSQPCSEAPESTDGWLKYGVSPEYRARPGAPHVGTLWTP
jgi:hypothetical protein